MIPLFFTLSYFNSHAHVERDHLNIHGLLNKFQISTHTLTWSVTYGIIFEVRNTEISTHTLTWSVTDSTPLLVEMFAFQLTRSRGA